VTAKPGLGVIAGDPHHECAVRREDDQQPAQDERRKHRAFVRPLLREMRPDFAATLESAEREAPQRPGAIKTRLRCGLGVADVGCAQ
jgi:hypothetical protein